MVLGVGFSEPGSLKKERCRMRTFKAADAENSAPSQADFKAGKQKRFAAKVVLVC